MKIYVFAAAACLVLFFSYFAYSISPPEPAEDGFPSIDIKKGDGLNEIAANLEKTGVIKSVFGFKLYAFFSQNARKLKPGKYVFGTAMPVKQIVSVLTKGPDNEIEVAIIEGETIKDINAKLRRAGVLIGSQKLLLSEEGYLFPDTYRFFASSSAAEVLKKFKDNFREKVFVIDYRTLIMASIIEKEVSVLADRFLVSGILWKRLQAGVPLQVDASVCYAKFKSAAGCYPLSRGDFSIDSRHNTYKYYGLPPSPIGNPGLEAIKAARHPRDSEFWYYLSDPKTEKTIFSRTLEEHNENRARYLGL